MIDLEGKTQGLKLLIMIELYKAFNYKVFIIVYVYVLYVEGHMSQKIFNHD